MAGKEDDGKAVGLGGGDGIRDGVRTFDELYRQVCEELRESGKSMDLCKQIKLASSDLNRIQLFLQAFPKTVPKFTNSIHTSYEKKSAAQARDLLEEAKGVETGRGILHTLTSALSLAPWEGISARDFEKTKSLDSCIDYLLARLIPSEEDNGHHKKQVPIQSNDPPTQLAGLSVQPESSESPSAGPLPKCSSGAALAEEGLEKLEKPPGNDLLSEIYFARATCLWGEQLWGKALLEFGSALICCGERGKEPGTSFLTFTQIYMIGHSLKMVGCLDEAEKVLHQALTHLRHFSAKLDNETKGRETLRIVKLLKEIKTKRQIIQAQLKEENQNENGMRTNKLLNKEKAGFLTGNNTRREGELYGNPNETLPAASDVLLLKQDNKRGRYVQAKKIIPPGATLIVDVPYSWSIYPRLYKDLCQHCCRKIYNAIPCPDCSAVVFCKWECWKKSEAYHKLECSILRNLDSSEALGEMGVLCYRSISNTPIALVLKSAEEIENQILETVRILNPPLSQINTSSTNSSKEDAQKNRLSFGFNDSGKLDPTDFPSLLGLSPNSSVRPNGDITKRTIIAIYLALCLRYVGYFKEHNPPPASSIPPSFSSHGGDSIDPHLPDLLQDSKSKTDSRLTSQVNDPQSPTSLSRSELLTAGLILRLSQALTCNAYGVNGTLNLKDEEKGIQQVDNFGGALYPTVSAINHSCNPNVFRVSWGKTCLVRSIADIQEGEEIRDSYGPLYSWMERKERKSLLKCQYFFDCDCQACQEDWPTFKDLVKTQPSSCAEENFTKCSSCATRLKSRKNKSQCSTCGQVSDGKRLMRFLQESEKKYKSAKELLLRHGNVNSESLQHITHHIATLQKSLPQPHKLILEAQEALKLCWNFQIQDSEAIQNPEFKSATSPL